MNTSRALRTSSSKQIVGSGVTVDIVIVIEDAGVADVTGAVGLEEPTVFWKQEQALLMLGEANALT